MGATVGAVVVGEADVGLVDGAWDSPGRVGVFVVGTSVGAAVGEVVGIAVGAVVVGEAEVGLTDGAWDSPGRVGVLVVGA